MMGLTSLLGIIELEKAPLLLKDFPEMLQHWLTNAGGFAAFGLFFWVLFSTFSASKTMTTRKMVTTTMWGLGTLALIAYIGAFVLMLLARAAHSGEQVLGPDGRPIQVSLGDTWQDIWRDRMMLIGGTLAMIAFLEPFLRDIFQLRWRRIWALAKLSFLEAVRRRVILGLLAFVLVFLFPAKWFFPIKPEDELRTNISVIYYVMSPLLMLLGMLLASFAIPSDVKNQTIHTIITKPVERFEIVLGRFIGYVCLLTIALFVLTSFSLILIQASNVDPLAAQESMKARSVQYGDLVFKSRKEGFTGIDVGRERAFRKYVAGGNESPHRAIWNFSELPAIDGRDAVPCEFAFDIYRTTKGEENRGVFCSFDIKTWKWKDSSIQEYEAEIRKITGGTYPFNFRSPSEETTDVDRQRWEKMNEVAKKFGRFEWKSLEVYDYHTYSLNIPAGLFDNAQEGEPPADPSDPKKAPIRVSVSVKCESPSQFIGVAQSDLFLLEKEGSFSWNFFKGALGLWCRLCIVVLVAVSSSTYLAGVISFLVALFLILAGSFQDFIRSLADKTNVGGGPFESLTRLVRGDLTTMELEKTATVQAAQYSDEAFRWMLRRVIDVIPDVETFTWSNYVSEGFNISPGFMAVRLLVLIAYMLPWFVLAYYLMRSREIAA